MKITFEKDILINALTPLMGVVSSKNTIAAISGVLFTSEGKDSCTLCAYDLEKGIKTSLSCVVEQEGSYILNAQKFFQIVRSLSDSSLTVYINEKNVVKITSGRSEFELHALNGSDFPNIPELGGENGFNIKQGLLRTMIAKTIFCVSQNDSKPAFNGVFFKIDEEKFTVVSSDRFSLAFCDMKVKIKNINGSGKLEAGFIIPGKALSEIMKLLTEPEEELTVYISRKHSVFKIGKYIFFTRLIDSEYIDYERFIPKESPIIVNIDSDDFVSSLERAALVTEDKELGQKKSILRCVFEGNLFKIYTESVNGRFYDEIPVGKSGEDITIYFSCKRLLDALRSSGVERLKVTLNTPLMGIKIEPASPEKEFGNGHFMFLVLPIMPPKNNDL